MSKLRPTLPTTNRPVTFDNGSAYYAVYQAVKGEKGLIHGRLDSPNEQEHCAIGCLFHNIPQACLHESFIDKVAAVNDSMPAFTPRQRRLAVLRWLRWKLGGYKFPGFGQYTSKEAPDVRK